MPFSARAGVDLNNDTSLATLTGAGEGDYVPGTTRNIGNRDTDTMLAAVNAWRAENRLGPVSKDQLDTNEYNRFDVRASKSVAVGNRRVEVIAQVFNLFGRDNLGAIEQGWVENALSNSFGRILTVQPRQQAELAVRFTF
jgi:hypothetical protein